jgi:hypothetical protein
MRPETRTRGESHSRRMRLLDKIAGSRTPFWLAQGGVAEHSLEVTGPGCYAAQVVDCPLRFVLGDDLTRACAELAFADGARLSGCLDLLRIPARRLWIEWSDEVHQRVIYETQRDVAYKACTGRRVGVLLDGSQDGCRAVMRTFWADADEAREATLSPLETHLDLRGGFDLAGGFACDSRRSDAATRGLLEHARFRFDDAWAAYYRAAAHSAALQHDVVHQSVAAVAGDAPLILAFLLLLTAQGATRSIPVSRAAINRKRRAHGRAPLLDHIEVRASLEDTPAAEAPGLEPLGRQSPRLHHVRGHLVRREDRVFWRVPHLRGSAARGMIRSRTVCLSFARHQLH